MENENKIEKIKKENNELAFKKLESQLGILLYGQKINREEFRVGFRQLADQNRFLSLQNHQLVQLNQELKQQMKTVIEELNQIKQERQEKVDRKEAWSNRKCLSKRDPITSEIYKELIKTAKGSAYSDIRLRIAICLLTIIKIKVNELLFLKVYQLQTVVEENWIDINRSNREPANHKVFLTKEGKELIKNR